jgi:hypothetical protein
MAQMIPDSLPPGCSIGEKLLFSRLQDLPDECIVYHEPAIGERYPDFVVVLPDTGLLVLEVKGWLPAQILGGDQYNITVRLRAAEPEKKTANPVRQAREYMYKLMDRCTGHPAGKVLLNDDGPHKGKFVFPFGFCAVLSQLAEADLQGHRTGNLREILPSSQVVAADEFEQWPALTADQLKERLASFFPHRWTFPRMTGRQTAALRSIIHPEVLVPPTPADLAAVQELGQQALLAVGEMDLRSLDLEQERTAREIGNGHRLLFGVAGSGKTVVLVARAKFLSEALPSGRILVLCFNVTLKAYLDALLSQCPNVDVLTFHGWGARNGVKWTEDEPGDVYGARLQSQLEGGGGDAGSYDAVLIDEAQDFEPSWFKCAALAMKEPRGGDLLIVGDRNQENYRRPKVSWAALGISAKGRTRVLRQNYRNTKTILAAAAPFADTDESGDGVIATSCDPSTARRDSGVLPLLLERQTRQAELAAVEETVRELLAGRFGGRDIKSLKPSEIGVLYRRRNEALPLLVGRLKKLAPVVWLNDPVDAGAARQRVLDPGIKVQTIFSAKGLQYRAVILVFAEQLGNRTESTPGDRHVLYVALTRPEDYLAVSYATDEDTGHSPLIQILKTAATFERQ